MWWDNNQKLLDGISVRQERMLPFYMKIKASQFGAQGERSARFEQLARARVRKEARGKQSAGEDKP